MELREALMQVSEIRMQLARTETFRGYRSATVGLSGLFAITGAVLQTLLIPDPSTATAAYLSLWIGLAGLSLAVCGAEMAIRCRRAASPFAVHMTRLAVEQFGPCVLAGGAATFVIARFAPESLALLPGLWAILFSLGVFASCWLLPKPLFWVGVWYLIAGVMVLALSRGDSAFSPWAMGIPFGVGQLVTAALLYWTMERTHVA